MNCLKRSLIEARARLAVAFGAKAGVGAQETADVRMLVPLSLVETLSANSSLPTNKKLRQKLRQVYELAI